MWYVKKIKTIQHERRRDIPYHLIHVFSSLIPQNEIFQDHSTLFLIINSGFLGSLFVFNNDEMIILPGWLIILKMSHLFPENAGRLIREGCRSSRIISGLSLRCYFLRMARILDEVTCWFLHPYISGDSISKGSH
jgi:hypothetical protein